MTDMEILKDAINTLGGLNVPIAMIDQFGSQVNRVRNNLIMLYQAIIKKQKELQATEDSQEEPEIDIQPADESEIVEAETEVN